MSNLIRFTSSRRTARGELHRSWLDGGTLVIYDAGSGIPADGDVAITDQTALVTFILPTPVGSVTDGILTAASIAAAMIDATGPAAFARAYDASVVAIGDYSVGGVGSGEAVELDNLNLIEGAYATVISLTVTEG